MNKPSVSLIISFYKRIDYLKLILASLRKQSFKDFEVVIADDGSPVEIVSEIEKLTLQFPFIIKHVWHEDIGFRKNRILNSAIESSSGDYIIFIDGDCIPHPEFINEHIINKEASVCLTGRRVNLSEKMTASFNETNIAKGSPEKDFPKFILDGLFGKSDYVEKGIYLKSKFLRYIFNQKYRGLLGCNFSLYKDDLYRINGFDERYKAPSIGEDSDIEFRLNLLGTRVKSLNNIAVQYHLYHKLQPRPVENLELFNKIKTDKIAFTPFGIHQ